jgi:hypothetical protein
MSFSTSKPAQALQGFGGENARKSDWQYIDVDGSIILEWVFKKYGGVGGLWIGLI